MPIACVDLLITRPSRRCSFGLAWYCPERIEEGACLVKFATPAWSCPNLVNLARYVSTPLLFAHVRAASDGNTLVGRVSYENCHPFKVSAGVVECAPGVQCVCERDLR